MIRKILMTVGIVGMLSFVSCGGGSSKEAKELLQKILQFIGIPQSIVVQVCQDSNLDGICNLNEAKTKVTINKGDSVEEILEKVSLTADGKFFLETYDPQLPILVELQDRAKVDFDEGKFTLAFKGFKTKEDDNETKEVSILESMVDAKALSKTIADTFRTLNNAEAQEKYYVALLDTLESNINILRTKGLDSQTAVRASIKEMGDESTTNQAQANRINTCANDQVCVDREIKTLSDELLITDEEASEIKDEEINGNVASSLYILPKGVMKDTLTEKIEGKSIPHFIDLSEMSVEVTENNIRVKINLVEIANELFFNKVAKNQLEYEWSILFDIDNNDKNSVGDIKFGILYFNFSSTNEVQSGSILDFTQKNLWKSEGDSEIAIEDLTQNISISGNSIIFDVPKSLDIDLKNITSTTKVQFITRYITNYDVYPNQ